MNLEKYNGKTWTASGLQVAEFCEYGGEFSGSIKCRVFVDQIENEILKDPVPWGFYFVVYLVICWLVSYLAC
jgi:hypothetical protein